jgi:hypothetical protein
MTPDQTQPIDLSETAELELLLVRPDEAPPVEAQPGRPSWEPDDGDFN